MSKKEHTEQEHDIRDPHRVVVIGATGGIGQALIARLQSRYPEVQIHACGRDQEKLKSLSGNGVQTHTLDILVEEQLKSAAESIKSEGRPDRILITTGILHDGDREPERRIEDLDRDWLQQVFSINTIGPALVAKYFLPIMNEDEPGIFAAWSARVGSISDNRLGGWYGYRASKAALNQIIRTLSIEAARRFENIRVVGVHPGTVDTDLSEPFQHNLKPEKVFNPEQSADYLLEVMENLPDDASGKVHDWEGKLIEP